MLVVSVLSLVRAAPAGSGGQDGNGLQARSYEVTSARLSTAAFVLATLGRQITDRASTQDEAGSRRRSDREPPRPSTSLPSRRSRQCGSRVGGDGSGTWLIRGT